MAIASDRRPYFREYYRTHIPYFREYFQAHREKINAAALEWAREHPEKKAQQVKVYAERHPERYIAKCMVASALRRGELIRQPCSICGDPRSQAHHPNYAEPLNVIWLCKRHHTEIHSKEVSQ